MSFCTVLSAVISGMKTEFVHVETDVSNGLPSFQMVGYLSAEVKEAQERVRTAILNAGLDFPAKRIVVNLAPATIRKKGALFDLPIAVSILSALGQLKQSDMEKMLFVGELGLDGTVRKVPGVLPIALAAKKAGISVCIVPKANAPEAALAEGVQVIGVRNLSEVYAYLNKEVQLTPEVYPKTAQIHPAGETEPDYSDICGQAMVKRATEIAVAGGHNLLLIGPPGSGKTMTAKRIPTIFPPLTTEESLEITQIYSVMGLVDEKHPLVTSRPFRSVHHTATKAALVGGGVVPMPGEISLAHGGVLFLDELPEFQKHVLEVLRQPLEEHFIRLARQQGTYQFPADFMLVAAMNPCPCGCYPDLNKCTCTKGEIEHYLGKISQPFLDRLDICVEAPKVEYAFLKQHKTEETSAQIRERVCRTREIQNRRYRETGITSNASMGRKELEKYCRLGLKEEQLMEKAFSRLGLTARTYHKILKVARTIADMEGEEKIQTEHLQEAIGYRSLDKKYWGRV